MAYHVEHATIHTAHNLFSHNSGGSGALYLTNSLVAKMTNSSFGVSWIYSTNLTSDSGVFESVGAGVNYLAASSSYRNAGTTTLSSNMLVILKKTTTYPPIELTGPISVSTTLTPQAQRDTDTPDLGYHFTPLDYLWGNLTISTDTTLVLTNGVAVGIHSTNGTILQSGARFISEGKPHLMNRLVRYQTVQEQPTTVGTTGATMTLLSVADAPATKPDISLRFTEVSLAADLNTRRSFCNSSEFNSITLRDCRLWNLCDNFNPASGVSMFALTNNIIERCEFNLVRTTNVHQMVVSLRNNYLSRSTLAFQTTNTTSPPIWAIRDNLFDTVTLTATGLSTHLLFNNNGYYATTIPPLTGGNDQSPGALDFQTGPLGAYYYPSSASPVSTGLWKFVDAGSRSSSEASLFHYTTRSDQVVDATTVDIGFHYIAVDSEGIPLDNDGDGIPNYLEDFDGDGAVDAGELSWLSAGNNSGGLTVFTPLQP